jgi:hypothetical protein
MPPAEELYAQVLSLQAENRDLKAQAAWFQRQVFGSGLSEKLDVDTAFQATLALVDTARAEPKVES